MRTAGNPILMYWLLRALYICGCFGFNLLRVSDII